MGTVWELWYTGNKTISKIYLLRFYEAEADKSLKENSFTKCKTPLESM